MIYQYFLARILPNGVIDSAWYTGPKCSRPKGWGLVKRRPYAVNEAGLV